MARGVSTVAAAAGLVLLLAALSMPLGPYTSAGALLSPATGILAPPDLPRDAALALPGLSAPVTVLRDGYGIPHIFASSDEDATAALGFVHAQDRLFQMEVQRRAASGRLSEALGPQTLEIDRFMRTAGIRRAAEASWADASATERRLLEAYARGVNGYLARLDDGALPAELKLLAVRPEPWEPVDSLAIGKVVAYGLSTNLNDLAMEAIERAFGPERTWSELFPPDNNLTVPIIPDEEWPPPGVPGLSRPGNRTGGSSLRFAGSNNWVVGPNRSATGAPLLAGDPHLPLQLPPIWYQAHLVTPEANIYGITGPGIPAVVIGFNDRIAWSMTTTGADVTDLYTYAWDDRGRYLFRDEWREPRTWTETIRVKGGPDVPLTVRETVHGPVLERFNRTFAVRATCYSPTHEGLALYLIARARNHTEFQEGLRHWRCPAQNIVYGDRDGNIAMWVAGGYPIRKGHDGRLPVNGSQLTEEDWVGFVPLEAYPHSVNPRQGYLVSANQLPVRNYTYCVEDDACADLGRDFADSYRARRIHELLRNGTHTLDTLARVHYDRTAVDGRELMGVLLEAYDRRPEARTPPMERAVGHLRGWGGEMLPDLVAPTLYASFLRAYRNLTWADDYIAAGLTPEFKMPSIDRLEHLTKFEPGSPWFDLAWTPERETRDDILLLSLQEGLRELESRLGPSPEGWTWDRFWNFTVDHLSGIDGLGRGPYAIGGWFFSVVPIALVGEIPPSHPDFEFFPGGRGSEGLFSASWRQLVDLQDPARSRVSLPGGQSGDFSGPHYDDQLRLWLRGEYITPQFGTDPVQISGVESRLELRPG